MSCSCASHSIPGPSRLWLPAGTSARFRATIFSCDTQDRFDLTGATLVFTLRNRGGNCENSTILTKTLGAGLEAVDLVLGEFDIVFAPADTANLVTWLEYFWSVEVTMPTGDVFVPPSLTGMLSVAITPQNN